MMVMETEVDAAAAAATAPAVAIICGVVCLWSVRLTFLMSTVIFSAMCVCVCVVSEW